MNLEDAVLLAIAEGLKTSKEVAKRLNVSVDDVERALKNLEAGGFVKAKFKGFIFKRKAYELTRSGFERVARIREKLRDVADEIREAYERGDREKIEEIVTSYQYFIPLMLMLSLIDLIWISALNDYDRDYEGDSPDVDFDVEF